MGICREFLAHHAVTDHMQLSRLCFRVPTSHINNHHVLWTALSGRNNKAHEKPATDSQALYPEREIFSKFERNWEPRGLAEQQLTTVRELYGDHLRHTVDERERCEPSTIHLTIYVLRRWRSLI